ncbi:MAG: cyclic nucleotide-binding domain-containing protein [Deltaproteobacteria bacterium]|nr:cyclic nucleotide-binding domain-containing protein [Deltaproteobacteria bacterium]
MTSLEQFLKTVRIFENLTEEELSHLVPLFEVRNAKTKERVIDEGDFSDLFYVIRSGHFNVTKGAKDTFITVLGAKEYFGEASLFHQVKRTAHVTANEDGQLLILHRDQFQQYLLTYPMAANRILFQMLKEVFLRLEETSNDLLLARGSFSHAETAIHRLLR